MREISKRLCILVGLFALPVTVCLLCATNTFAVQTNLFGEVEDDGTGCSIYNILVYVINTFSIGVGVIATIGIIAVGIMYMTARDNESQTAKAKKMFFDIVIGIITYVLFYLIIGLFLPGGVFNETKPCEARIEATSPAEGGGSPEKSSGNGNQSNSKNTSNTSGSNEPTNNNQSQNNTSSKELTNSEKIALAAKKVAKQIDGKVYYCHKRWRGAKTKCTNCAGYATAVYQEVGLLKKNTYFAILGQELQNSSDINKKKLNVNKYNQSISSLVKSGKVKPGDIVGLYSGHHTMIYKGKKNGKYVFFSLGRTSTPSGKSSSDSNKLKLSAKKILNYKTGGGLMISYVISPKRNININYP